MDDQQKQQFVTSILQTYLQRQQQQHQMNNNNNKNMPPIAIDAQLKMVLLSTSLLTSPSYTGPPFELLIARFYVNELHFATKEITNALLASDLDRAIAAWEYGKDSWNSYFTVVNRAIVPKVGGQFEPIH
mmetsp:Transcript_9174/g.13471  ORF Transcript_9174/g.13471 Transcript_9174/m.13471 type:complete len:130 (+) Transcript_9174:1-390(+)